MQCSRIIKNCLLTNVLHQVESWSARFCLSAILNSFVHDDFCHPHCRHQTMNVFERHCEMLAVIGKIPSHSKPLKSSRSKGRSWNLEFNSRCKPVKSFLAVLSDSWELVGKIFPSGSSKGRPSDPSSSSLETLEPAWFSTDTAFGGGTSGWSFGFAAFGQRFLLFSCVIRKLFGKRSIGFFNALHARALFGIFLFVWHCSKRLE